MVASRSPDKNARTWASVCHISALAIFFGLPFGNILGPLIVYLIKKDDDPFIAAAGREALNFQIFVSISGFTLFMAYMVSFFWAMFATISSSAACAHPPIFVLAIFPIFFILAFLDFLNVIIASVRSYNGEVYRYPISLRFVKP